MNTRKLAAIEKGCRLDERIFEQLLKNFSMGEFKTEKDVARFIDSEIRKSGAKKSFRTIVASGANAVDWHHNPLGKKLRKGFCVIDFGARFDSYCSDVTRTIYLGKASKTEKRRAQELRRLFRPRPGTRPREESAHRPLAQDKEKHPKGR